MVRTWRITDPLRADPLCEGLRQSSRRADQCRPCAHQRISRPDHRIIRLCLRARGPQRNLFIRVAGRWHQHVQRCIQRVGRVNDDFAGQAAAIRKNAFDRPPWQRKRDDVGSRSCLRGPFHRRYLLRGSGVIAAVRRPMTTSWPAFFHSFAIWLPTFPNPSTAIIMFAIFPLGGSRCQYALFCS